MLLPKIKKVKGHHKDLRAELQTCLELCFSDKKHGRDGHSSHNHSRSRTWRTEFALVSFTLSHGKKPHQQSETVAIMIHFPPTCHSLCGAGSLATVGWRRGDHPPTEWNRPLRAPRGQNKGGSQHGQQSQVSPSYFIRDPWFTTKPLSWAEQWIFSHILFQSNKPHLAWRWPALARQWPQLWVTASAAHEAQVIGIYLGKHLAFFHTCNYFKNTRVY